MSLSKHTIKKMAKGIDKKLDDAWSLLVKLKAGNECEYCHNKQTLNSHHVFTRTNKSTRWDIMNGICLCAYHHTLSSKFSAHGTPTIFAEWLIKKRGESWHNLLRIRAHSDGKRTKFEKEILLKELQLEIKKLYS
jgi:hypothetical protein